MRHAGILKMPNIPQFAFVYYETIMPEAICAPINYTSIVEQLKESVSADIKLTEKRSANSRQQSKNYFPSRLF